MDVTPTRRFISAAREELRTLTTRSHRVFLVAALTGAITGLVVAGFERVVVDVVLVRVLELPLWLVALMPGIGLLVALVARRVIGAGVSPSTADEYLRAFHDTGHRLGWRAFAARMVAAVATLGSGAPMGLEGPSLYAGATIGARLQQRLRRTFRGADHRGLVGRRRGCRRRCDLQGPGDRGGVRPRGPVPR